MACDSFAYILRASLYSIRMIPSYILAKGSLVSDCFNSSAPPDPLGSLNSGSTSNSSFDLNHGSRPGSGSDSSSDSSLDFSSEYLEWQLGRKRVRSEYDRGLFLPEGVISRIITKEAIRQEVPGISNDLIDFIDEDAKKLFAIAVLIRSRGFRIFKLVKHFPPVFDVSSSKLEFEDHLGRPNTDTRSLQLYKESQDSFRPSKDRFAGKLPNIALKELSARLAGQSYRAETAFEVEATALDELSELNHPHLLKRIASFTRDSKHYFLFEWADGGNLRDFWRTLDRYHKARLSKTLLKEVSCQIRGLSHGICVLHNLKDSESWRHGDLKPENILRFTDPDDPRALGVLQIADFGLAKRHDVSTGDRSIVSNSAYGSARYAPPEAVTSRREPRSRVYDIWSMGCIVLEFVIWPLYGFEELDRFHGEFDYREHCLPITSYFFSSTGDSEATVHPTVIRWFDRMFREDICGVNTFLGEILRLIKQRLLVVELPNESEHHGRATAVKFRDTMDKILLKIETVAAYLPNSAGIKLLRGPPPERPLPSANVLKLKTLDDRWEYSIDNMFANEVLSHIEAMEIFPQPHGVFRTTHAIIDKLEREVDLDELPRTIQDAVKVTREINQQFLWVDSICIIQDDSADWEQESQCMEQVFSSVYCVLAAGSSEGLSVGFLRARSPRKFVTLEDGYGGELNKRGWVLQERALARRTIHFTSEQAYWECGEGIRCETLTKMTNLKSGILGDSNFPDVASNLTSAGEIHLYQSLYEKYSRLAFTEIRDRPIAIIGLENRWLRAFRTRGKYGIFEAFLHRTLLWQRGDHEIAMRRIDFLQGRSIPTWSWLAYRGISYMNILFDSIEWNVELSEAFCYSAGYSSYTEDVKALGKLDVLVRDYDVSRAPTNSLRLSLMSRSHRNIAKVNVLSLGKRR
ncbi:hypothetical protein GGR58DRAFT_507576 [Xylaria digitata]|nr:hypothetical protein GGR58DRAFT_507576 [Xylaria digitata]